MMTHTVAGESVGRISRVVDKARSDGCDISLYFGTGKLYKRTDNMAVDPRYSAQAAYPCPTTKIEEKSLDGILTMMSYGHIMRPVAAPQLFEPFVAYLAAGHFYRNTMPSATFADIGPQHFKSSAEFPGNRSSMSLVAV